MKMAGCCWVTSLSVKRLYSANQGARVNPWTPWPVRKYLARESRARADWARDLFAQYATDWIALEQLLPLVDARALIVWGDQDRIIHPSCADVFAAGLRHTVASQGCWSRGLPTNTPPSRCTPSTQFSRSVLMLLRRFLRWSKS